MLEVFVKCEETCNLTTNGRTDGRTDGQTVNRRGCGLVRLEQFVPMGFSYLSIAAVSMHGSFDLERNNCTTVGRATVDRKLMTLVAMVK